MKILPLYTLNREKLFNRYDLTYNIFIRQASVFVLSTFIMTTSDSRSLMYRLLNFISRQPIQLSRLFARMLASLVNGLKLTKTSKTIQLNLKITLPYLNDEQRHDIIRNAIRNELMSYMEFFSIWGSSNEKIFLEFIAFKVQNTFTKRSPKKGTGFDRATFWYMGNYERMVRSIYRHDHFI